jgi:hypothetical protein
MERKKKILFVIVIVTILILLAVFAHLLFPQESDGIIDEEFPGPDNGANGTNATVIANGTFQDGAHDTSGSSLLIEMDDDLVLRFENFKTDSGPGLYVYLSVDLEDDDYVNLGKLKGTEGNMNYDVPTGTNTTKYNHVLIWCEPFSVLFGYATFE